MIRFMTELFPIIPAPVWVKNRSQPISTQNVIDYLLAALDNWNGHGQVFEIGGPDIFTYQELMLNYATIRGHKRKLLLLPYVPVWFMAFGIGLMTPVPRPIAHALVGGLSSDSVVIHNDARRIYPEVNLIDFESAAKEALTHLHPHKIERVWDDGQVRTKILRHEGFFIDQREIKIEAPIGKIFDAIKNLAAHVSVESVEDNHILLVRSKMKIPGAGWAEWRVNDDPTCLSQTVFFTPRGLGGFLFWYLCRPFYILVLNNFIKNIDHNSVVK
jgi:hypothetical protein